MRPLTALLSAMILTPTSAYADVIGYDFRGQVESGVDGDGVFGAAGRDLSGLPYRLRIVVDFNRGGPIAVGFPYSHGGEGTNSPVTVQISVDGNGFSPFDFGTTKSYFAASDPLDAVDFTAGGSAFAFSFFSFNFDGYSNRIEYQRPPSGSGLSYFTATLGGPDQSFVNFGPTVVPLVTPVPEPAAWAMMIGGLAMTGARVRRRRHGDHVDRRTSTI